MKRSNNYDSALGMFIEPPRVVKLPHIIFLRWLADRERLEHTPVSAPKGELAIQVSVWEHYANRRAEVTVP